MINTMEKIKAIVNASDKEKKDVIESIGVPNCDNIPGCLSIQEHYHNDMYNCDKDIESIIIKTENEKYLVIRIEEEFSDDIEHLDKNIEGIKINNVIDEDGIEYDIEVSYSYKNISYKNLNHEDVEHYVENCFNKENNIQSITGLKLEKNGTICNSNEIEEYHKKEFDKLFPEEYEKQYKEHHGHFEYELNKEDYDLSDDYERKLYNERIKEFEDEVKEYAEEHVEWAIDIENVKGNYDKCKDIIFPMPVFDMEREFMIEDKMLESEKIEPDVKYVIDEMTKDDLIKYKEQLQNEIEQLNVEKEEAIKEQEQRKKEQEERKKLQEEVLSLIDSRDNLKEEIATINGEILNQNVIE